MITISLLIMTYGFINFKKSFFLFLIFQLVWFRDAQLLALPGAPSINLDLVVCGYYCILFFWKQRRYASAVIDFPLKRPMTVIGLSMLLTSMTAVTGSVGELFRACGNICTDLLILVIMWEMIETKEDFIFLFKGITLVIFCTCLYGIFTYFTHQNSVVDYKFGLTRNPLKVYGDTIRGYRMQSVFEHPIAAAMDWSIYITFVMHAIIRYNERLPYRWLVFLTWVIALPCIILTKMRTGIFFLMISILPLFDIRKRKAFIAVLLSMGIAFAGLPYLLSQQTIYKDLLISFFDKTAAARGMGSSLFMRIDQVKAVAGLMKMSPLTGLGEKFGEVISNEYTIRALGYESLWFEQMSRHGLFGIIAYLILIYYTCIKLPRKFHSVSLCSISTAFWSTYTLTSLPYVNTYLLYLVMFYFIKRSGIYNRVREKMRRDKF